MNYLDKNYSRHSIKAMSFNLRLNTPVDGPNAWPYRKDFVLSLIESYDPDLLGVQEALPEMFSYLQENLNKTYEAWGRGRAANGSDEASGLFFKRERWNKLDSGHFWLSETPYIPGSFLPNVSFPRMVSWVKLFNKLDNNIYFYFNTHYAYENEEVRFRETEIFIEQIKNITQLQDLTKGKKIIISGDFNAMPREICIKLWTNSTVTNLRDTIDAIIQFPWVDYGTFHAWTGKANGTRIDYVLVSDDFELINYEIIHETRNGRYPSDHFPIIAEFLFEKEKVF